MGATGGKVAAAWYADPCHRHEYRYWDGEAWTDQVSDHGQTSNDPVVAAATVATGAQPVEGVDAGRGNDEESYSGPPVADLQQADVIDQLMKMGASLGEADMKVQTALVVASTFDSAQIEAVYSSSEPLTRENLAVRWAVHCIYHGARAQQL